MQNLKTANNVDLNEGNGWREYLLEDCIDILDNQRVPINSDDRAKRQGKVPYYGATGQVGFIDDFLFDEELVLLGEDGAPFLDKSKPIAYIVNGKSWVNNHAHVLRAKSGVTNNWFIKYYLDYFNFADFVGGTTRLKLNQSAMKNIPIRLPRLDEQEKIASLLKEAINLVEQNKLKVARAKKLVSKFKQSILSAAVTGKLTENWREARGKQEVANNNDSYLEEFGVTLPNSWGTPTFDDVSDDITVGFVSSMTKEYRDNGVPFFRSLNIKEFSLDLNNIRYVSKEFHQNNKKSSLKPGDLVIVRTGNAGTACVIPESIEEANCSDLVIVRPSKKINVHYACIYMNAPLIRRHVIKSMVGIAQGHFNISSMRTTPVPLPPLDEQEEIVKKVNEFFDVANKVEKQIEKAETRVSKLTQAILAKTFNSFAE